MRSINKDRNGVHTVSLGIFRVLGVMNSVIGNGWERDFMLVRRVPSLLLPLPLAVTSAAWT